MNAKRRKGAAPEDPVLFVRVDRKLSEAVQGELERRRAATPGVALSKSDVVRALLWKALDAEDSRATG